MARKAKSKSYLPEPPSNRKRMKNLPNSCNWPRTTPRKPTSSKSTSKHASKLSYCVNKMTSCSKQWINYHQSEFNFLSLYLYQSTTLSSASIFKDCSNLLMNFSFHCSELVSIMASLSSCCFYFFFFFKLKSTIMGSSSSSIKFEIL
jgi:hypothetical protein